MKQLSLDNLRTFVTVVDMGGYAKAGEVLGRSQPAISLQIKKLEEQLARKLFSKSGQRHIANADGQQLYQHAIKILSLNDDIFRQFEQPALRGRLRLGIPSEFATTLLPGIIGEFSKLYPDVALEVTSALSRQLLSKDKRDEFDLIMALVPEQMSMSALPAGAELLASDPLVWVGDKNRVWNADYLSLVLAPDGCMYRSRVIQHLKQQTQPWRISYTIADLSGITAALQQGLGITALARSSLPPELSVIRHPHLPNLGTIDICLFQQSHQHPQACAKLAQFIKTRVA